MLCWPWAMRGRSGSAPAMAVSGAGLSPLPALLALEVEPGESDRLRRVGRSGSPAGALLEVLLLEEDEVEPPELELSWLPLPSFLTRWGWPSFSSPPTTWGVSLPCFGFARFGGLVIGFHAP